MRKPYNNYFSGDVEQTDKYILMSRVEAEEKFIIYFHRNDSASNTTAPETFIQQLDSGKYDADLVGGLHLVAAIWHGMHSGAFALSNEQNLVLWRWVIAAVFVSEMFDINGVVEVKNEQGRTEETTLYTGEQGGIVIYPWLERFALANHVEGLAYEIFPTSKAPAMAVAIYRSMIDISPLTGTDMSEEGLKGMALLHDSFIETLKTEGIPSMPVSH